MTGDVALLAEAFIKHYAKPYVWDADMVLQKRDTSDTNWAIDEIVEIGYKRPAELLPIVLAVLERTSDMDVLAVLAAGPLEDYLVKCGDAEIERIEALAASDDKFKNLLAGVWKNAMSNAVWDRVCACRGEPW